VYINYKGKTGVEQQVEGDEVETGIQWVGDMKVKLVSFGFDCCQQVDC